MPAPKGHEPYNVNDEGGRPREYNTIEVSENILKWASEETSLNLNGFCARHGIPPEKISRWAKEDDRFRQVLSLVKSHLADRREQRVSQGALHQKAYDLNAKVYDAFLKEEWREQLAYETQLKAKEAETVTEEQKAHVKQLFDMFNAQSSLKIDDKSKINEAKS